MTLALWDRRTVPSIGPSLIGRLEGCRLAAYRDSVGVLTIGIGSTVMPNGVKVRATDRLTQDQANALLVTQCERWVGVVEDAVSWPIDEAQAATLISFVHNLGPEALEGSTLAKMANAGNLSLAADQLGGWCVAGGKIELGLMRRREYERRVFIAQVQESAAAYDAVWRMQVHDLMPAYAKAFSDARAWGWKPEQAAVAVRAVAPAGKPVPHAPAQASEADALDDQFNPPQDSPA